MKCKACGRLLTDRESIAAGYGPVCATRAGLSTPKPKRTAEPRRRRASLFIPPEIIADARQMSLFGAAA